MIARLAPALIAVVMIGAATDDPASRAQGPSWDQARGGAEGAPNELRQAMLASEDARASTDAERAPLYRGLARNEPALRRQAVRALGRLEDAGLLERIAPLLADSNAAVRAEAANALGQAVVREPGRAGAARERLIQRLASESDADAAGAICRTLGRLPCSTEAEVRLAEERLVAATTRRGVERTVRPSSQIVGVDVGWRTGTIDALPPTLAGAVDGLESLLRLRKKIASPARATLDRLRTIALSAPGSGRPGVEAGAGPRRSGDTLAPIRRLALMALVSAGPLDEATLRMAVDDPDWQVRRLAVASLATVPPGQAGPAAREVVVASLGDRSPQVRVDGVRAYARHVGAASCAPLLSATANRDLHVSLAAIDALPACKDARGNEVIDALTAIASRAFGPEAERVPRGGATWHAPAHALVALAKTSPVAALAPLQRAVSHPAWQARMYAARAAAEIVRAAPAGAGGTADRQAAQTALDALAADPVANVRTAALDGLATARGHDADRAFIAALTASDYQLVMTASRALAGSPDGAATVPPLLAALARITAERRDTSRDARRAIVDRLKEFGSAGDEPAMSGYLDDADPVIAAASAAALTAWTGQPHQARAGRIVTGPPPSIADLDALARSLLEITMADGGRIALRLLPAEAPLSVLRVARLAREGYYDGLTFHRVVSNFVVQGGSPGANEYAGDGAFMRDEVGRLTHARGTVGISTRGRDTGDAQLFINLVDNPRLDHDYTVFAEVVAGMDRVDAMAEGDVMKSVRLVTFGRQRRNAPRRWPASASPRNSP